MRILISLLAAGALVAATSAAAQSISYETDRPAPVTGNPDRMVCKKEEKIGSRLQVKKTCLTAREWQLRYQAERELAEKIQSGTRACDAESCTQSTGKVF